MITELRKLLVEATSRPWWVENGALGTLISDGDAIAECYDDADAALIVAAVNALPKLLDLADAVRDFKNLREERERQTLARLDGVEIDPAREIPIDGQAHGWKKVISALAALDKETTK